MSEFMRKIPFEQLMNWCREEYKKDETIFGVHKEKFYFSKSGKTMKNVFGEDITTPVGPAEPKIVPPL